MTELTPSTRSVKTIRRVARIWSIVVIAGVLLLFFGPDSESLGGIAPVDIFLLLMTGVALIGLMIAFRWELLGGILTLTMLFLREIAWVILKGSWELGFLILWFFIAPPAILFLIAWKNEKKPGLGKVK